MRNLFHALCLALNQSISVLPQSACVGNINHVSIRAAFVSSPYCHPSVRDMPFSDSNSINVVGCGLWYLNPTPFTSNTWNHTRWLHYNDDITQLVRSFKQHKRKLILSTVHHVCKYDFKTCSHVPFRACRNGQRNARGSQVLSHIVRKVASAHSVSIFDAHSITKDSCNMNIHNDDLHFHRNIFNELSKLWNCFVNV